MPADIHILFFSGVGFRDWAVNECRQPSKAGCKIGFTKRRKSDITIPEFDAEFNAQFDAQNNDVKSDVKNDVRPLGRPPQGSIAIRTSSSLTPAISAH